MLAASETVQNPFRYASYYYDTEIGLYYLWHRYYDPELRRFLSCDPGSLPKGLTQAANSYLYVLDAPTVFVDRTGGSPTLANVADELFVYASEQAVSSDTSWPAKVGYNVEAFVLSLVTTENVGTTMAVLSVGGQVGGRAVGNRPSPEETIKTMRDIGTRSSKAVKGGGRGTNYVMPKGTNPNGPFSEITRGLPNKPFQTQRGPGRSSVLPDGTTVGIRPGSSLGQPTIQIDYPNGSVELFRFPGLLPGLYDWTNECP